MNKKISNEEALAKIKIRISHFFEEIGRGNIEETEQEREELIEDIDEICNQTEISKNYLILQQLLLDKAILKGLEKK